MEAIEIVVGCSFKPKKKCGSLKKGIEYLISGFGKMKDIPRTEFWEILDKYNPKVKPIHLSKESVQSLYERGLLEDL